MPRVSVIVPTYREAAHIAACISSIQAQEVEGGLEVIVADGSSPDETAALARAAGATVLNNPERTIPAALNRCLAAASGETIVRFDAHAEMPPGYVQACLRALAEEQDAANVGGWREARGTGPWGRALGAALASPLGVGNARIWRPAPLGAGRRDVDTVPLGCFPAKRLREVGGWREDLLANEDFELNHRLRQHGWRVVFDPAIWSIYRPRETPGEIASQYWRYGTWKGAVLRGSPAAIRPRQLAPIGLLGAMVGTALPGPLGKSARATIGLYGSGLAAAAARSPAGWRFAAVLATMHVCWAAGLARGLANPIR